VSGALRLVLARHGQTPANVARVLDTRLPGPGLTDLGRAQAEALGRELADEGRDGAPPVVAVYHSAARRAAETAELACAPLDLVPRRVEGVHEVQVGDLEGRNDEAAIEEFGAVFDSWLTGDLDRAHPHGESGRDVVDRFVPVVEGIRAAHADGTVVLVSHGATLRLAAPALLGFDPQSRDLGESRLGNCARIVLRAADAGAWMLEAWLGEVPGDLPASHDATG
jgi:broad specificity phosphatase PhoE